MTAKEFLLDRSQEAEGELDIAKTMREYALQVAERAAEEDMYYGGVDRRKVAENILTRIKEKLSE